MNQPLDLPNQGNNMPGGSGVPELPTSPVAGWYTDPADAQFMRYWDGTAWSDYVELIPTLFPWRYTPEDMRAARRKKFKLTMIILLCVFGALALAVGGCIVLYIVPVSQIG